LSDWDVENDFRGSEQNRRGKRLNRGELDSSRMRPKEISTLATEMVTMQMLINVLLQKGVISLGDLSDVQRKNQMPSGATDKIMEGKRVAVHFPDRRGSQTRSKKRKLRHLASRYGWSRYLGERLFGWKWRRRTKADPRFENFIGN